MCLLIPGYLLVSFSINEDSLLDCPSDLGLGGAILQYFQNMLSLSADSKRWWQGTSALSYDLFYGVPQSSVLFLVRLSTEETNVLMAPSTVLLPIKAYGGT